MQEKRQKTAKKARFWAFLAQNRAKMEQETGVEPVRELLEDYERAKSEKIPFSGKKKDEQIIALRTKNEQLEREIEIRGKDQSNLFKQLQEAQRTDSRKETAYKIVSDMITAYPDEFDALLHKSRAKKNPSTSFKSNQSGKDGK